MERMVGIDWGEESHQVELQTDEGTVVLNESFSTTAEGRQRLRDELLDRCEEPGDIKVGIEDPNCPIVRLLLDAGMEIFVIPPLKLGKLREVYSEAGAKDDVLDAHVICDELRVHRNVFYQLTADQPVIEALRRYYRAYQDATGDVTRYANKLRHLLRDYFPHFLELDWSVNERVMLDLFELVSTPDQVDEVTVEQIKEALGQCRKHSASEILEILEAGTDEVPDRVVDVGKDIACRQARNLRAAKRQRDQYRHNIEQLLEEISEKQKSGELPSAALRSEGRQEAQEQAEGEDEPLSDVEIIGSTLGVGTMTTAGLVAEGFEALVTLDRQLLRRQSIAPVTIQTGKQSSSGQGPPPQVRRRYARNRYLNDTMHQLGDCLQRSNDHYRGRYSAMRDRNHTHGRACRQVTDQYLRVLFAMLRDRTLYDPTMHGATRS